MLVVTLQRITKNKILNAPKTLEIHSKVHYSSSDNNNKCEMDLIPHSHCTAFPEHQRKQ